MALYVQHKHCLHVCQTVCIETTDNTEQCPLLPAGYCLIQELVQMFFDTQLRSQNIVNCRTRYYFSEKMGLVELT